MYLYEWLSLWNYYVGVGEDSILSVFSWIGDECDVKIIIFSGNYINCIRDDWFCFFFIFSNVV